MGSKGGSANQSKNVYGTIAGAFGWGPLDWLYGLVCNGNYIFQGSLTLTSDVTDLTSSIVDPKFIAPGGYLKLYRGTSTQPADAALIGQAAYLETIVLVGKRIFFGQDSGTPPNVQLIGGRLPRVDTSVVAAADNVRYDDQVNPIASLAENILDERGLGMDISELDVTSWLASAHWCAQDTDHKAATFCSPLINEQSSFRDLQQRILEPIGGYLCWTKDRKLACKIYEWGTDPGGLFTLDERHDVKVTKTAPGDWIDIKTEYVVSFTDRAYEYQNNSITVPNARAAKIRQLNDPGQLERKDYTKATQVHRSVTEYIRRVSTPPGKITIQFAQMFAPNLLVGDKIKVNVSLRPGSTPSAQLCRVDKIDQDRSDLLTVDLTTDGLLPAVPYSAVWADPTIPDYLCSTLTHMLAIPLPLSFANAHAVGFCVSRPTGDMIGFNVYFSTSTSTPFHELGAQQGFAVRAQLVDAISSSATTANILELDGVAAPDAELAANTPGGNATMAADDTLLAIFVSLDGSGRLAMDGSGRPIMEWASIVSRTAISGAEFGYTVLRGRQGTPAAAWAAGTQVWIIPKINLEIWEHELIPDAGGQTLYFRLEAFNRRATDITSPLPDADLVVPSPVVPTVSLSADGVVPKFFDAAASFSLGTHVKISHPIDPFFAHFEVKATYDNSDASVTYTWASSTGAGLVTTRELNLCLYNLLANPGYVRVRVVDIFGVKSAWAYGGNANANMSTGTGDVSAQSAADLKSTGLTIAQAGGKKQLAQFPVDDVFYTTSSGITTRIYVPIPSGVLLWKPDEFVPQVTSSADVICRYDWDDTGNSATQAAVVLRSLTGVAIGSGDPFRIHGLAINHP